MMNIQQVVNLTSVALFKMFLLNIPFRVNFAWVAHTKLLKVTCPVDKNRSTTGGQWGLSYLPQWPQQEESTDQTDRTKCQNGNEMPPQHTILRLKFQNFLGVAEAAPLIPTLSVLRASLLIQDNQDLLQAFSAALPLYKSLQHSSHGRVKLAL